MHFDSRSTFRKAATACLAGLLLMAMTAFLLAPAHAQQLGFDSEDISEVFTPVFEALGENDVREAERIHKQLGREHGKTADWHYIDGVLNIMKLQDASALRMPFLARGMRNSFQRTIETDPGHELGHMSLALFLYNAPGIVGGDKEKAREHLATLTELNSKHQYSVRVTFAMIDDVPFETEEPYWQDYLAAFPDDPEIRLQYASRRINSEHFELADEQLTWIEDYANPEEYSDLLKRARYQMAKLAAESGTALERGRDHLQMMLDDGELPPQLTYAWAYTRMAQIYRHLGDLGTAERFLTLAEESDDRGDNLEETLVAVRNQLDQDKKQQCPATGVC